MSFVYPWVLVFLAAVPLLALLAFWLLSSSRRSLSKFISPSLYSRFCGNSGTVVPAVQTVLVLLGLVLLIVAAARPQWGRNDVKLTSKGRNLIIALDVSRSMLASDVHPNRLERAKADIMDLVNDLKGDRAGILAFRGKGLMLCPPTSDYAFLRQTIDGISIDSAPRGETDIADAILKCLTAFGGSEGENNAIILISDGEDLAGRAEKLAAKAGEKSIPVFTVGIGDPSGADVPDSDGKGTMKYRGESVKSRLTESTLEAVAKASGGVYIPLATSGTARTTLGAIYRRHLAKIAEKEMEELLSNRLIERYQIFLIAALVFFLATAFMSRGRLASGIRRGGRTAHHSSATAAAVLVAVFSLASSLFADTNEVKKTSVSTGAAAACDAQSLYKKGEYEAAAGRYLDAVAGQDDPEIAARYRYNSGVASFKAGDLDKASSSLLPIISKRGFGNAAELYGAAQFKLASSEEALTNNQMKAECLSRAATGFQNALRENPQDEKTIRNLARSVNGLPALRNAAHTESVVAKYANVPPQQMIDTMLNEERAVIDGCLALSTNRDAAAVISGLEALSKRQKDAADIWIPLKGQLANPQAFTNEEQLAQAARTFDAVHDAMDKGAELLEDIDSGAFAPVAQSEDFVYGLWKTIAEPPQLLNEGMLTQTNVLVNPTRSRYPMRGDWPESLALTDEFTKKFPEWAEKKVQESQADTNSPPFTAEMAQEIMKHMESIRIIQQDAVNNTDPAQQKSAAEEVVSLQKKVSELMPKQKNNQQNQNQQQNQQQQNQDQQQQQQDQQQNQDQDQNQDQQQDQEQDQDQDQEQEAEESEDKDKDQDVKEILRRALERESEHEREKKDQRRKIQLPVNVRDW